MSVHPYLTAAIAPPPAHRMNEWWALSFTVYPWRGGKDTPRAAHSPLSIPLAPRMPQCALWWTERKYRLREFQEWRDEKSIWMYTLWPQNIHLDTIFNVK